MIEIQAYLEAAILKSGLPQPDDLIVTRTSVDRGDFATPVALSLAKLAKQSPAEVAQRIVTNLDTKNIEKAEVVGPGFINIKMSDAWFEQQSEMPHHLKPFLTPKKYIIEYSSPNIAKPMHVGHLRTTILGQVLANLFRLLGGEVTTWSHPGDWGTQFGKLIVAWQKWGEADALNKAPIDELLRVYVKFHQEAKDHPELEADGRAAFKALQDGDPEAHRLWQMFTKFSLEEFDRMYKLLNISFDVVRGESSYNDQLHGLVNRALEAGVAKKSEGAVIIPLEEFDLPPFLIQKSDGATLYGTADLAMVGVRGREYAPDEVVIVTGNEQTLHFQQLVASAAKFAEAGVYGAGFVLPKLTHVSYGFFRLAGGKMSTRQGEIIRLDDVIKQAIEQANKLVQEKNPELKAKERQDLATTIGIGAVKYTDLAHNRHTDVVFDWDKMFSLEGNSVVYLMYTYARCNSLLNKSGDSNLPQSSAHHLLSGKGKSDVDWSSYERNLLLTLLELDNAAVQSVEHYDPHHLLNHFYKVASEFSRFYNTDPILKAPDGIKNRRLRLTALVKDQLKLMFDLLNIEPPDRL